MCVCSPPTRPLRMTGGTVPVLALLAPWARFLRRPQTAIQLHTKKGYRRPWAVAQPHPTLTPLLRG
ncbi:hypothetical protein J6590_101542, partial [Homalodisca vitripennis]